MIMNKIQITGRLTTDPELKTTNNGINVCTVTLAVKRPRTKDTTDFINCTAWRQGAEYLSKYARKGNLIGVSGTLTSRKYEDKDGNKRTTYEIQADDVEILSSKGESAEATAEPFEEVKRAEDKETPFADDEMLPF